MRAFFRPTVPMLIENISTTIPPQLVIIDPEQLAILYFKQNFEIVQSFMTLSGHESLLNALSNEYLCESNDPLLRKFYFEFIKLIPKYFVNSGEANEFIFSKYNSHNLSSITRDIASSFFLMSAEENLDFRSDAISFNYSMTLTFSNLIFFILIMVNKLTTKKEENDIKKSAIISSDADIAFALLLISYCALSVFTTISYIGVELNKLNDAAVQIIQHLGEQMMPKYFADYLKYSMNVKTPLKFDGFVPVIGSELEQTVQTNFVTISPFVSPFFKIYNEPNFVLSIKIVSSTVADMSGFNSTRLNKLLNSFETISQLNSLLRKHTFDFSSQDPDRFGPFSSFINSTVCSLSTDCIPMTDFNSYDDSSLIDFLSHNLILCIICSCCKCDISKIDPEHLSPDYPERLPQSLFAGFLDTDGNVVSVPNWDYNSSQVDGFAYDLTLVQIENATYIKEFNLSLIKYNNYFITCSLSFYFFNLLLSRLESSYFGTFNENSGFISSERSALSAIKYYEPPSKWKGFNALRDRSFIPYVYDTSSTINNNYSGQNAITWNYNEDDFTKPDTALRALTSDDIPLSKNGEECVANDLNEQPFDDYQFVIVNISSRTMIDAQKRALAHCLGRNGKSLELCRKVMPVDMYKTSERVIVDYEISYYCAYQFPMLKEQCEQQGCGPMIPLKDVNAMKTLIYFVLIKVAECCNINNFNITTPYITKDFGDYDTDLTFITKLENYCERCINDGIKLRFRFGSNEVCFTDLLADRNTDKVYRKYTGIRIYQNRKSSLNWEILVSTLPDYCKVNVDLRKKTIQQEMEVTKLISHEYFDFIGRYIEFEDVFCIGGTAISYYNPEYTLDGDDRLQLKFNEFDERNQYIYTNKLVAYNEIMESECKSEKEFNKSIALIKHGRDDKSKTHIKVDNNVEEYRHFINNKTSVSARKENFLYNRNNDRTFNMEFGLMKKFIKAVLRICNMNKSRKAKQA
jgi:hypothetical protein